MFEKWRESFFVSNHWMWKICEMCLRQARRELIFRLTNATHSKKGKGTVDCFVYI